MIDEVYGPPTRYEMMFGKDRETAPPRRDPEVLAKMPVLIAAPNGQTIRYTYEEACDFHREMGQMLARMLRSRGSNFTTVDPDSPVGGTPAAAAATWAIPTSEIAGSVGGSCRAASR